MIREAIAGADLIAFDPYIYGGGHASFISAGYDCSGSISFALHAAGLLSSPLDSTEFETWGKPGPGRWITIWANGGHAYMEIAGLWFDTVAQSSRTAIAGRRFASPRRTGSSRVTRPAGRPSPTGGCRAVGRRICHGATSAVP